MKAKHYLLIGSLSIIVILLFTAPYIKEYKLYKKAIKGDDVELCNRYLYEYINHKHAEQVKQRKDDIAYERVQTLKNLKTCDWYIKELPNGAHCDEIYYLRIKYSGKTLPAVNDYLSKYPYGLYAKEVNQICDSLWDSEIEKYQSKDKKKLDPKAMKYMQEMLEYMKKHRVYSVYVNVDPTLQLKDYNEYSQQKRTYLESLYEDESLPLKGNVISLKSNFSQGDVENLKKTLINGVQKSFNSMFTPGFITIVSNKVDDVHPNLTFKYTIKSQEDSSGYPYIWTYSTSSRYSLAYTIKAYLIGISIQFKAIFTLPESTTEYEYSQKGEPENDINGISDISDGYRRMTEACFQKFSNKMSTNLGLDASYN